METKLGIPKRKSFNASTGRDYADEYRRYHSRPDQIKKRAARNAARAKLAKQGRVHKGDGTNVDHRKPLANGGSNSASNLRVLSESQNKGFPRSSSNRPRGSA